MWSCPNCDESLDDHFAICWQCGTNRQGRMDAGFQSEADESQLSANQPAARPITWQFSLWSLFVMLATAAISLRLIEGARDVVTWTLAGIIGANLLGWFAGLFVTYGLGFPNDGSLTWRKEQNEEPEP